MAESKKFMTRIRPGGSLYEIYFEGAMRASIWLPINTWEAPNVVLIQVYLELTNARILAKRLEKF